MDYIEATATDDMFKIVDQNDQPIAQFDSNGLTVTDVKIAAPDGAKDPSNSETDVDSYQVASTLKTIIDKVHVAESNIAKVTSNVEIVANDLEAINNRTEGIEASADGKLSIADESGAYFVAQFDSNGLTVTDVQAKETISARNIAATENITAGGDISAKNITATESITSAKVIANTQVETPEVMLNKVSLKTTLSAIDNNISAATGRISAAETEIGTLQEQTSTLIGTDTEKSVRTIATEVITDALIPDDAQASLKTLQEIADWIQDHPDDAAAMNTAISSNTTAINNLTPRVESVEDKTQNISDSATTDYFTIVDSNDVPTFQVDESGTVA